MLEKIVWNKMYSLKIFNDSDWIEPPLNGSDLIFASTDDIWNDSIYNHWLWKDVNYYLYFNSFLHFVDWNIEDIFYACDEDIDSYDKIIEDKYYTFTVDVYEHGSFAFKLIDKPCDRNDSHFMFIEKKLFDNRFQAFDYANDLLEKQEAYINWSVYWYSITNHNVIQDDDWNNYTSSQIEDEEIYWWYYNIDHLIEDIIFNNEEVFNLKELQDYASGTIY